MTQTEMQKDAFEDVFEATEELPILIVSTFDAPTARRVDLAGLFHYLAYHEASLARAQAIIDTMYSTPSGKAQWIDNTQPAIGTVWTWFIVNDWAKKHAPYAKAKAYLAHYDLLCSLIHSSIWYSCNVSPEEGGGDAIVERLADTDGLAGLPHSEYDLALTKRILEGKSL